MILFKGEVNPGVVVFFDVLLKAEVSLGLFPPSRMLSNQASALLVGEFKGYPCAGFHRTGVFD